MHLFHRPVVISDQSQRRRRPRLRSGRCGGRRWSGWRAALRLPCPAACRARRRGRPARQACRMPAHRQRRARPACRTPRAVLRRAAPVIGQQDAGHEEAGRQDRRGPRQQVGGAAAGQHAAAAAAADAERAAFRVLHQHDADQRGGDDQMDQQQYGDHDSGIRCENIMGVSRTAYTTRRRPASPGLVVPLVLCF